METDQTAYMKNEWSRAKTLGLQIMENCRNELYSRYPYLDGALASLPFILEEEADGISTDGEKLYLSPAFLLSVYAEEPERMKRGYLHVLLHCLYLHLFPRKERMERGSRRRWDLACDIAVNLILDTILPEKGKKRAEEAEIRNTCYQHLRRQLLNGAGKGGISAEQILYLLETETFPYEGAVLEKCFAFDSHARWYEKRPGGTEGIRMHWEELLLRFSGKNGGSGHRGEERGFLTEEIEEVRKGKYDYRRFLKQFTVMREEPELDMETFDYIFYDLGFQLFGNFPLVEPLEYKEVNRLEELVIAIDTSHSCSKETVQRFLNETYAILGEKENFFRKFRVYLMQCDAFLQESVLIRNEEEWKEYIRTVQIRGRSGTDFRPVFSQVEKLRAEKELKNLKALIYFTDGDGIYPEKKTDYETAFVFLERNEHMEKVPSWAHVLVTEERVKSGNEH